MLVSLLIGLKAGASNTLFEGYYRLLISGKHSGYFIMKHEFDPKKKIFIATTFMKIVNEKGEDIESVKAMATENYHPLSYSYTSISGGKARTIDAKFSKNKMNGTIVKDGKTERISNKAIDPNAFLSVYLIYTVLRSPKGMQPKTRFDYIAIAEENGDVHKGFLEFKDFEKIDGIQTIRARNVFMEMESENLVSEKGEVLVTAMPAQKVAIELVAQPSVATADFKVPSSTLKNLFGEVPTGQKNVLAQRKQDSAPGGSPAPAGGPGPQSPPAGGTPPSDPPVQPAATSPKVIPEGATKQRGVPGGKGIHLKVKKGDEGK